MRSHKKLITGIVVALVIIGIVAAVVYAQATKSEAGTTVDTSSAVSTDAVAIADFAFGPKIITVKSGTTVTWTNNDAVRHSVTADDGSSMTFDSGLINSKATYAMKFDKAGTYHYHCTPHPYMKGTVVVTD